MTSARVGAAAGENVPTIPEMLRRSARQYAGRTALRSWSDQRYASLTYAELGVTAERFAAGLVALGLQPGEHVAIVAENGPRWAIAYLGIVTAGGVGVPVYSELDGREIGHLLEESDSRFAVISGKALDNAARHLPRLDAVVVTDQERPTLEEVALPRRGFLRRQPPPPLLPFAEVAEQATPASRAALAEIRVRPHDLASIVYTSGTSGDPKGVMLTHRNIVSNAIVCRPVVDATKNDRVLLVLPLHHTLPFTGGLMLPLHVGALVAFENDLRRIRDRLHESRATIMLGVPALYAMMHRAILSRIEAEGQMARFNSALHLVDAVKRRAGVNIGRLVFRALHQRLGGSLRVMVSGGAALPPDLVRKYALLGIPLIQGWGLTEASPVITGQVISPFDFHFTRRIEQQAGSVGRPIQGVEVALIDVPEKNVYVPIHGEGELVARGPNIMLGYYKNEAATSRAMLGDWLRTGDMGRIDKGGNVYITGRAKYVIVLDSGEKVYPEEVEERLAESPLVADVCVVGRQVRRLTGGSRIEVTAVVHPNIEAVRERARLDPPSLSADTVRRWVSEDIARLQQDGPAFKRVTEVVLTDTPLPKTPLRKVRRELVSDHHDFDLHRFLEGET